MLKRLLIAITLVFVWAVQTSGAVVHHSAQLQISGPPELADSFSAPAQDDDRGEICDLGCVCHAAHSIFFDLGQSVFFVFSDASVFEFGSLGRTQFQTSPPNRPPLA
jgi:hypothetical protein